MQNMRHLLGECLVQTALYAEGEEQIRTRDQKRRRDAEPADDPRQMLKTEMHRAVPRLLLHLLCHAPVSRRPSNREHLHLPFSRRNHTAAEQRALRICRTAFSRYLGDLTALSGEGGLIHLQFAADQHPVRRNALAALQ